MKKKNQPLYVIAFIVYLILLIKFLVLNHPLSEIKEGLLNLSLGALWDRLALTQWLPFKSLVHVYNHHTMASFFSGVGRNLVWFIPMGFFIPIWYKKHKFLSLLTVGMTLGLCLEVFMFLAVASPLAIDPILCAGFGTLIGYSIFKLI